MLVGAVHGYRGLIRGLLVDRKYGHVLKMDRSFVSTILTDPRSRVIVDSTNQMAHAMGPPRDAMTIEDAERRAVSGRVELVELLA